MSGRGEAEESQSEGFGEVGLVSEGEKPVGGKAVERSLQGEEERRESGYRELVQRSEEREEATIRRGEDAVEDGGWGAFPVHKKSDDRLDAAEFMFRVGRSESGSEGGGTGRESGTLRFPKQEEEERLPAIATAGRDKSREPGESASAGILSNEVGVLCVNIDPLRWERIGSREFQSPRG